MNKFEEIFVIISRKGNFKVNPARNTKAITGEGKISNGGKGKNVFNWTSNKSLKREFEEKILEHINSLYNLAIRMTQNKQDAEDLVQEASLKAYRYFDKFKQGTNFRAWIMTIARNIYINNYRKRRKEPQKIEFEEVQDFISLPEINGAQEEIFSEVIKSAIDKLPEELRTTIILFFVEDFSYKEIAKIMDVPLGTVMSRLYTARQVLKRRLLVYVNK